MEERRSVRRRGDEGKEKHQVQGSDSFLFVRERKKNQPVSSRGMVKGSRAEHEDREGDESN